MLVRNLNAISNSFLNISKTEPRIARHGLCSKSPEVKYGSDLVCSSAKVADTHEQLRVDSIAANAMTVLDQKHTEFKAWAEEKGVKISGLSVAKLPGKGIGVVANRKLKVTN
jgi:hypothetical protein